jgi:hypothetical protein
MMKIIILVDRSGCKYTSPIGSSAKATAASITGILCIFSLNFIIKAAKNKINSILANSEG